MEIHSLWQEGIMTVPYNGDPESMQVRFFTVILQAISYMYIYLNIIIYKYKCIFIYLYIYIYTHLYVFM